MSDGLAGNPGHQKNILLSEGAWKSIWVIFGLRDRQRCSHLLPVNIKDFHVAQINNVILPKI
jgi:hypothetical protein